MTNMTTEGDLPLLQIQPDAIDDKLECIISILKELKDTLPTSLDHIKQLMQSLKKKEAVFGKDYQERPVIQYVDEGKPLWDASNANKLTQPKTDEDVKSTTKAFLKQIDYLKEMKPPSGVVLDPTHVQPEAGYYREDKEFTKTEIVLGRGNTAGKIIVVKDNKTEKKMALKTVMVSVFRGDEIIALMDQNETGISPAMYCFQVNGQMIEIFMEIIKNAVTLRYVIDYGMGNISQRGPNLVRYFSLYVFHSLLSAVQKMHDKGWTHRDLHADNIMLQESSVGIIQTRILDFGRAKLLISKDGLRGFRTDMAEVVRKFTSICIGQEFDSETDVKKNWEDKIKEMAKVLLLSEENTSEILDLVDRALRVTTPSDVPNLLNEIEVKMNGQGTRSMLMDVEEILFPNSYNHPDSTGTVKSDQNDARYCVILMRRMKSLVNLLKDLTTGYIY